ncbi:ABC transporter permease [Dongshaea marina]|uniref:ABC transporter permease n=1 Tax=Dongshaea marina TaxID=2047966 RepID=UPI001F4134D2|nr:ABC transporter permease [Dongshaea marina]
MTQQIALYLRRLWAIVIKEFLQLKRDKVTIAMVLGIPVLQLILFGYAVNTNPKQLPTIVVTQDQSPQVRTLITAMENTNYFKIVSTDGSLAQAQQSLARGDALFVVEIPAGFTHEMIAKKRPEILVVADASDPGSTGNAVNTLEQLASQVFDESFSRDGLGYLNPKAEPFQLIVHQKYNPEQKTQYNIVPGLMGVILTMTMVMVTSLAITRERERGTMESLLATPVRPLQVMIGKIIPYLLVGYIQMALIYISAIVLFAVPMRGSLWMLALAGLPFIAANLMMGITFSTLAKNQLQAMQMTFFFFLPSILLSGFMFPFLGMPQWAQWIGEVLPVTHFLRVVRGSCSRATGLLSYCPNYGPSSLLCWWWG